MSAAAALSALAGAAQANFSYAFFFGAAPDITTQGPALWDSGQGTYNLTVGPDSSGQMWHNQRQNIRDGFVSSFVFRIDPGSIPGDGFAFVVQNDAQGTAARGGGGSEIGFGPGFTDSQGTVRSIHNAVAVEFDTFGFGGEFPTPHVSIQSMNASGEVYEGDSVSLGHADLSAMNIDVLDQRAHIATVQYKPAVGATPARLEVYVDDIFACSAVVDLGHILIAPSTFASAYDNDSQSESFGTAYVGFTGGTGLADSTHRLEGWAFNGATGQCLGANWWLAYSFSGCGGSSCDIGAGVYVQGTRPVTYDWKKNDVTISDDEGGRVTGIDTHAITWSPANSNDSGYYRCDFWNQCGTGVFGDFFMSTPETCNDIDFNNDGLFPDTADVDDFLSVFSGGPCVNAGYTCDPIDFNNDGLFPDTLDIDSFLSVFSGGACLR